MKKMAKTLRSNEVCGGYRKFGSADMCELRIPGSQYGAESTVVSELDSEYGTGLMVLKLAAGSTLRLSGAARLPWHKSPCSRVPRTH